METPYIFHIIPAIAEIIINHFERISNHSIGHTQKISYLASLDLKNMKFFQKNSWTEPLSQIFKFLTALWIFFRAFLEISNKSWEFFRFLGVDSQNLLQKFCQCVRRHIWPMLVNYMYSYFHYLLATRHFVARSDSLLSISQLDFTKKPAYRLWLARQRLSGASGKNFGSAN